MFRATIISIDNSVECILNTVLFITLVIVCPFYLFTLLSLPPPSFMTVFPIETDEVCFTQSSHYIQKESILTSLFVSGVSPEVHILCGHTTPLCDGMVFDEW